MLIGQSPLSILDLVASEKKSSHKVTVLSFLDFLGGLWIFIKEMKLICFLHTQCLTNCIFQIIRRSDNWVAEIWEKTLEFISRKSFLYLEAITSSGGILQIFITLIGVSAFRPSYGSCWFLIHFLPFLKMSISNMISSIFIFNIQNLFPLVLESLLACFERVTE